MDRRNAIATAAAIAMGIGAIAVAIGANVGSAAPEPLGKLRQSDTASVQKPQVITVTVDATPSEAATGSDEVQPEPVETEIVTETVQPTVHSSPRVSATAEPGDDDALEHESETADD